MSISVACTCGKKLLVKDELAGKRGKCPACGTMLTIPQPTPVSAEQDLPSVAPLDEELYKPVPWETKRAEPDASLAAANVPAAKGSPFYCPRCGAALEKTLNAKSLFTQLALGLSLGFYFVPTAPFRCPRCGPIQYDELSKEESYRAQEIISARGCFKLGCAVMLGSFLLLFLVGYVLQLLGVKLK